VMAVHSVLAEEIFKTHEHLDFVTRTQRRDIAPGATEVNPRHVYCLTFRDSRERDRLQTAHDVVSRGGVNEGRTMRSAVDLKEQEFCEMIMDRMGPTGAPVPESPDFCGTILDPSIYAVRFRHFAVDGP